MGRKILLIFILVAVSTGAFYFVSGKYQHKQSVEPILKDGDIAFQTLCGDLGEAIQLATHSKYDQCGIIYKEANDLYVYEAIGPVTKTPLDEWIKRGNGSHFVIKRLKDTNKLSKTVIEKMKNEGKEFYGKDYDGYFDWSDDKIYCSELVWKIYKRGANIEIGKLQHLKDFDLTSEPVKKQLQQRYGYNIPLEDTVISPISVYNSDQLILVTEN